MEDKGQGVDVLAVLAVVAAVGCVATPALIS